MVGNDARIRVSSSTLPSLMGTLKSTRMKTRWPARSRSRMDSLGIFDCQLLIADWHFDLLLLNSAEFVKSRQLGLHYESLVLKSAIGNRKSAIPRVLFLQYT